VSSDSRAAGQLVGFQNFSYLTYQPDYGRFTFALRASARYNYIQNHGYGTDAEFYLAPEVDIRTAPKWAFTLLYEMGASHQFGDKASYYTNDGTDLEPGVEWDPTSDMVINPYLIVQTGGKVNFSSTALGMFFTWTFL
jgi:hypothetical protein